MKRHIPKACERCKQAFLCGYAGCWCSRVPITNRQYADIVEQYDDCLCPSCLAELAGQPCDGLVLNPPSDTR
ncbi:MAG: hypothetical protein GKS05_11540 [Nitrospirales bacterium]|nr:hypothetical protein [Nitrospirales bacterium]